MELHSTQPSSVMENGTELNTTEVEWNPHQMEWNEDILLEEAKALLEKALYPFKKVYIYIIPSDWPSHVLCLFGFLLASVQIRTPH